MNQSKNKKGKKIIKKIVIFLFVVVLLGGVVAGVQGIRAKLRFNITLEQYLDKDSMGDIQYVTMEKSCISPREEEMRDGNYVISDTGKIEELYQLIQGMTAGKIKEPTVGFDENPIVYSAQVEFYMKDTCITIRRETTGEEDDRNILAVFRW